MTVASTIAGADGSYAFANVAPGTYRVHLDETTAPAGMGVANGANASDVPVAAGQAVSGLDFAVRYTGVVGDRVWHDLDSDGAQDQGEPGLGGVSITLSRAGADGVWETEDDEVVGTTASAADGSYEFAVLPPGTYRVSVASLPLGSIASTGTVVSATVALDQVADTVDFGLRYTGEIGDLVWLDKDVDGVRDAAESGVAGTSVSAVTAGADATFGTADDVVEGTAETDADGAYLISNLRPATYRVSIDGLSIPVGTAASTTHPVETVLDPHEVDESVDFGVRWTGSIGDRVWLDHDADGQQDAGEPGIGGVQMTLVDLGADGILDTGDDVPYSDVYTAADGSYAFTSLPPAKYRVVSVLSTAPPRTGRTTASNFVIQLGAGEAKTTADFGFAWWEWLTLTIGEGNVTTLSGNGTNATVNGNATTSSFRTPGGSVVVGQFLYVLTAGSIRRVSLTTGGTIILAGDATATGCVDSSTATSVRFGATPGQMTTDGTHLYVGDYACSTVRKVSIATGATSTVTSMSSAFGVAIASDGYLYAGSYNGQLYRVNLATGAKTAFTATSVVGLVADGTALFAINQQSCAWGGVCTHRIVRIGLDGAVSTLAGDIVDAGVLASAGDYLYARHRSAHQLIRVKKSDGSWAVVAGTTSAGYADGVGTDAWFNAINGIASDSKALYVSDHSNHRIRKVAISTSLPSAQSPHESATVALEPGQVTTVAGNGSAANVNATGVSASFKSPGG
ncbi:MAG TPA: SdrD B-like domain-containing protein, partial [Acidimicrobiales bacterium]